MTLIIHCNQPKPVGAPIIHQPILAQQPQKDCMPHCHLRSKPLVFDKLIYDEGQDLADPQQIITDHGWRERGNGVISCYYVTYT